MLLAVVGLAPLRVASAAAAGLPLLSACSVTRTLPGLLTMLRIRTFARRSVYPPAALPVVNDCAHSVWTPLTLPATQLLLKSVSPRLLTLTPSVVNVSLPISSALLQPVLSYAL